jgi:predicted CopG family antitoxin
MGRKRDLSREEWCEVGRMLRESKETLWRVVQRIQGATRVSEVDKIIRLMRRFDRVQLDLENVATDQHPAWGDVISALAGHVPARGMEARGGRNDGKDAGTIERAERGS